MAKNRAFGPSGRARTLGSMAERKPYAPPTLTFLGTVSDLTHGAAASMPPGMPNVPGMPPMPEHVEREAKEQKRRRRV